MTTIGRRLLWVCAGLSAFGIVACSTVWGFDDLTGTELDASSDGAATDGASDAADSGTSTDAADSGTNTDAADSGTQCLVPTTCPGGPDTFCGLRTCVSNACGFNYTLAGTVTPTQTTGDCHQNQCNGSGGVINAIDNSDTKSDNNDCTTDTCSNGTLTYTPTAARTVCAEGGGKVLCNGAGVCVQCILPADCGSATFCSARTCTSGVCGVNNTAPGTPTPTQTTGDCHENRCDGSGGVINAINNLDVFDDGKQCTDNICTAGVPSNPASSIATLCNESGGVHCDGLGDCVPPPMMSCATSGDGRTNCGSGSESCCTSLLVSGGTYNRTYTNTGSGPTGEADPATVSDFRLDKYEVTVGRFRQFVAAWNNGSGWTPPAASGKHTHLNSGSGLGATGGGYEPGWATLDNSDIAPTNGNLVCDANYATWTPTSAGGHEKLPVNCVNWWEAVAFCIWDGGFLPSEAEWEYAAAGGSAEREYPWGPTAPGTTNQYAIYGCYYPSSSGSCTNVSNIAPVGTPTAGAGKYGQLDLAGNVVEWNLDWYAAYAACTNCTNATIASGRVLRGSFFNSSASYLLPPLRSELTPTNRVSYTGFRCARTP